MTRRLALVDLALTLPGRAAAGVVVGNLIVTARGGVGIYQRGEHLDEVRGLRQELTQLAAVLTPQRRIVSDRLREEPR